jgi:hypothetical protein
MARSLCIALTYIMTKRQCDALV